MKDRFSIMKMIRNIQNYVVVKKYDLNEIFVIAKRIEKKRNAIIIEQNVVIIKRDEIIRELNETKTTIRFLQNDLTKQQQNQSSTDQFIRLMKTHSFVIVITSVFIDLDALKVVKSAKLLDEKALTNNDKNKFEN